MSNEHCLGATMLCVYVELPGIFIHPRKNMPSICYCYAKKKEEGAGVVVFVDLMSASPSPGQSHRSGVS